MSTAAQRHAEAFLQMGIYRHYKGPLYQVLGLAHDANADTIGTQVDVFPKDGDEPHVIPAGERTVVVYIALQLDGAHLGPRMAVRTLEDFTAVVHDNGTPCDGIHCLRGEKQVPRFEYLGPVLTKEML